MKTSASERLESVNKGGKLLDGSARVLILTQSAVIKDRGVEQGVESGEEGKDKRRRKILKWVAGRYLEIGLSPELEAIVNGKKNLADKLESPRGSTVRLALEGFGGFYMPEDHALNLTDSAEMSVWMWVLLR